MFRVWFSFVLLALVVPFAQAEWSVSLEGDVPLYVSLNPQDFSQPVRVREGRIDSLVCDFFSKQGGLWVPGILSLKEDSLSFHTVAEGHSRLAVSWGASKNLPGSIRVYSSLKETAPTLRGELLTVEITLKKGYQIPASLKFPAYLGSDLLLSRKGNSRTLQAVVEFQPGTSYQKFWTIPLSLKGQVVIKVTLVTVNNFLSQGEGLSQFEVKGFREGSCNSWVEAAFRPDGQGFVPLKRGFKARY